MPIAVACQCGQRFQAKDELAGRVVKCPKCGQALRIPTPQQASPQPPQQATPQGPQLGGPGPGVPAMGGGAPAMGGGAALGGGAAGMGGGAMDELFDEVGIENSASGARCMQCGAPMPAGGFICVHCGYNHQTGERVESEVPGMQGDVEYESFGNEQLDRAAREIDQRKQEQRGTGDPVPWWIYLIGLFLVCSFVGAMVMFMPKIDLTGQEGGSGSGNAAGMVLALSFVIIGGVVNIAGSLWLLVIAFRENFLQGIMVLFVPCYVLFYAFSRWEECGVPFLMSVGGNVVSTIGSFIMGALAPPPQQYGSLPRFERPAYVAQLNPGQEAF